MGAEWRPVSKNGGSTATLPYPSDGWTPISTQKTQENSTALKSTEAQPRWYEPKAQPQTAKAFVSSQDVRQLIATALGSKLAADFQLFLGDNVYYLQPVPDAQEVVNNSGLARATYMPETFDCDDYAVVLKSHFCEAAYKNYQRRAPHCFGLIWGELPHVHAINWMINDDYRLRFVEPQTGQVFEPNGNHRNITFMMA